MIQQIIEVIVSPTGETKLQTKGFAGASCQDASKFLEAALGLRASEQLTAEYYAQHSTHTQAQEGQS